MKKIPAYFLFLLTCLQVSVAFSANEVITDCISTQSSSWLSQEQWVWEKLCNREVVDLNQRLGFTEPVIPWLATETQWSTDRIINRSFLYDILFSEPYVSALQNIPITISGAWYTEPIVFSGVTVNNFLELVNSRFDEQTGFISTIASHRLSFNGSWLRNELILLNLRAEPIYLQDGRYEDTVMLVAAVSDDVIIMTGSEFHGYVNMSNLISKFIVLDDTTTWGENAQMSLRGAIINQPAFTEDSWSGLEGKLDLQGLVYEQFTVNANQQAEITAGTAAELPLSVLLGWLEMQESREEIYIPQPYEQLASVLNFMGQESKSDQILYEKNEYRRLHPTTAFSDKVWLSIKKYIIGYGYQIWLTVIWFISLIGCGTALLRGSKQGKGLNTARCLLYSLDQAVPLVYLNPANEDVAKKHPLGLQYYFQTHQVLSLILLSFLGAGLAGAIG
jgi:hypothetical protein